MTMTTAIVAMASLTVVTRIVLMPTAVLAILMGVTVSSIVVAMATTAVTVSMTMIFAIFFAATPTVGDLLLLILAATAGAQATSGDPCGSCGDCKRHCGRAILFGRK